MKKHKVKIGIYVITAIVIMAVIGFIATDISGKIAENKLPDGFSHYLKGYDICALAIDSENIWAGGANGLFQIKTATNISKKIGSFDFVRALLSDKDGIWVGHENGLTFIGKNTKTLTIKDGLPDNRVNCIMTDGSKLWAGTWGGAAVFENDTVKKYTSSNGLLVDMVNVITKDDAGGIWFGSYVAPRGGISVLKDGKWRYFTTSDDLLHANINAIALLHDKRMFTGGGLYTKGGGTFFSMVEGRWKKTDVITKESGLAGEKIRSLFQDSQNRLWIGSEYDGLAIMKDGQVLAKLTEKEGLSCNEVKFIKEDINGNVWIGTRDGVTKISKGGLNKLFNS